MKKDSWFLIIIIPLILIPLAIMIIIMTIRVGKAGLTDNSGPTTVTRPTTMEIVDQKKSQ